MENEINIYNDYFKNKYANEEQCFEKIMNKKNSNVKHTHTISDKTENSKNSNKSVDKNKLDDTIQNNSIEDVKPFDKDIAIENVKAYQESNDGTKEYVNRIIPYINQKIKEASLKGLRFCKIDITELVNDTIKTQYLIKTSDYLKIANIVVDKYKKYGYKVLITDIVTVYQSGFGYPQKVIVKIIW